MNSVTSWYQPYATTTATTSSATGYLYFKHMTGTTATWVVDDDVWHQPSKPSNLLLSGHQYTLPDGSEIEIDAAGNWKVAKAGAIQYRASNVRNFNKFLNASDLLEDFIRDCGALGVRQGEFLKIPIHAFINWLIFKAAEADGEESPVPMLPASKPVVDRCLFCKRFLAVRFIAAGVTFCNGLHLTRFMDRERALALLGRG